MASLFAVEHSLPRSGLVLGTLVGAITLRSADGPRWKVLISAIGCEPGRGSEPGAGWNCVLQMAKHAEVWVLTQGKNRKPVERALNGSALPSAHFVYFELPLLQGSGEDCSATT
jgi:hypothetical protein